MLDKKHTSKQWEQLWKDLENTESASAAYQKKDFEGKEKYYQTKNFKTGDFGIGASMMAKYADPIQGLQAEIRSGAGHIEFSPSIQQGQGMHTFTKLGEEKRQALREIAKINETTIATHAHPAVTGLTGFNERSYSFEDEQRKHSIDEVKKAIDFAADIGHGGSITFHAGDFVRPLAGQKVGGNNERFERSPDEKDQMLFAIIDHETKKPVEGAVFRSDQRITAPVFDYSKPKQRISGIDKDISIYPFKTKEDKQTVQMESFETFKEYAAWLVKNDTEFQNKYLKDNYAKEKIGNVSPEALIKKVEDNRGKREEVDNYYVLEKAAEKRFKDEQKVKMIDAINNVSRSINTIESDLKEVDRILRDSTNIAKEKDCYIFNDPRRLQIVDEETAKKMNKEDIIIIKKGTTLKDALSKEDLVFNTFYAGNVFARDLDARKKELSLTKQTQLTQIEQQLEKLDKQNGQKNFYTVSEYARLQNQQSFGDLGIELYEKNKAMKAKNPNAKDLYFAVENLFPEKYGAHPEELLDIITNARKAMTDELKNKKGMSEGEAKKIANNSIKATFDTGHLHMWKKYFKRNEGESESSFNKRFNKWAVDQTKKLVNSGVIGNIHLADNFGYDDDHVMLGEGNVPIKEYLQLFDKAKADGKITGKVAVESFDDSGERHGVHEAWKATGVQVFKSSNATEKWVNPTSEFGSDYQGYSFNRLQDNYLGQPHKPYFIFGKYSPDQEEWAPWSETRLE